MKKIVIFGASGNVGSYFTKYCAEYFPKNLYQIIATGRRQTTVFKQWGVDYCSLDISQPNSPDWDSLPQKDVHAVILLAAEIPSYMNEYHPEKYIQSNICGAFNVLEYCRKVKADRILYTTTVFDISLHARDGVVLKPDMPKLFSYSGDHAMYVISKNTATECIRHYHEEYGLKNFIFRLPTIYCYSPFPYYYPNGIKTMRPIYQMIFKAMKSEPIELWGNPQYSKDMVHVYDFSQMLCKAIECTRDSGQYNIGTGVPVTLKEQIETIIDVFSPKDALSKIVYRPDKKSSGGYLMDIENAKQELGYLPVFSCKDLFEDFKKEMELNRFADLRLGR